MAWTWTKSRDGINCLYLLVTQASFQSCFTVAQQLNTSMCLSAMVLGRQRERRGLAEDVSVGGQLPRPAGRTPTVVQICRRMKVA
jgi:hypothetical protein